MEILMFDLMANCRYVEGVREVIRRGVDPDCLDRVSLGEFVRAKELNRVREDIRIFIGPYWPFEIVDSMSRWIQIVYPVDASHLSGAFGTSIRVSDVLRWLAEDGDPRAEYLSGLADRLDANPAPRPTVSNPEPDRENLALEYSHMLRLMTKESDVWSLRTLSDVEFFARKALEAVAWGEASMPPLIPFPLDHLPSRCKLTRDGYDGRILSAGWLLRRAIQRADYISDRERHQLKLASHFYPDPQSAVAVRLENRTYEIGSFKVSREHSANDLGDLLGSIHLDHFGGSNKFSPDVGEFPFRLHRPANPLPGEEEHFYLVSELITYIGFTGE
jgi:hypothetical protein